MARSFIKDIAQSGITHELKKDCRALKETAEHFKAKKRGCPKSNFWAVFFVYIIDY